MPDDLVEGVARQGRIVADVLPRATRRSASAAASESNTSWKVRMARGFIAPPRIDRFAVWVGGSTSRTRLGLRQPYAFVVRSPIPPPAAEENRWWSRRTAWTSR
ncbi:MAG: hypothetical protein ABS81_06840 [Pseudonocardia sp. SCN 72-86]|nr:MAG: hypothetical protein ABS81_06840 [Pseudonocardia sp. SCN 72-86]